MNGKPFFEIKKGDPSALSGLLTVYTTIASPNASENVKHPVHEMARSGILGASGDYRTQQNLGDFLKKEFGLTLEDLSKPENAGLAGFPEVLNADMLKKKIESLKGFEALIPTPARMEYFDSEHEILAREGDVFYLGAFDKLANANLAINAFPILYQAIYREQVLRRVASEIDKMLGAVAGLTSPGGHYLDRPQEFEKKIQTEFIPEMIYNRTDVAERDAWSRKLREFMAGYNHPEEVEKIISLAVRADAEKKEVRRLLELYVEKIGALLREDYKVLSQIKREIDALEAKKR